MRLLVFAHVDGDQLAFAAVEDIGQCQRRFGLAHAGRADKQEDALRLVRILQIRPGRPHALRNRFQRMILANHPFLQQGLQVEDGIDLVLDHLAEWNPRPRRDDLGDDMAIDLQRHHRRFTLQLAQAQQGLVERLIPRRLGGLLAPFSLRPGIGKRRLTLLQLAAQFENAADQPLLLVKPRLQDGQVGFDGGNLRLELRDPDIVPGTAGRLTRQGGQFCLFTQQALVGLVDQGRRCALPERDLGAGGVQHADRLVRQLTAADVAVRQADRFGHRLVQHADAEVLLHQRHHAAQHGCRQRLARLLDLDDLETAGQRGILLEILLVFGPRCRRHGAQLAASQRRLEQVGRIVLAGLPAGPDHGVRFVDEQDDRLRAFLDLVDDVLQAILEFTLDAGPGLQQAHVEGVQFDTEQGGRYIFLRDAQCQPFHHRRLANPRLAGQDRVVLPAAHEDVDHLANFTVAPDDRVDLAVPRPLRQVGGELVEGRGFAALRTNRRQGIGTLSAFLRAPQTGNFGSFSRTFGHFVEVVLQFVEANLGQQLGATEGKLRQFGFGEQGQQQVT